jgi:hypothetical protein
MSEKIDQFCESLRVHLTDLETDLNQTKTEIAALPKEAQEAVHTKLAEAKAKSKERQQKMEAKKASVENWLAEKRAEVKEKVEEWRANREADILAKRADRTEEYAAYAIAFAVDSIQEARLAVLEAVAARMAADDAAAKA